MTGFYYTKTLRAHEIPEGFKQCERCWGYGEVVKIWRDPGPNEMMSCPDCDGKGYVAIASSSGNETK